MRTAYLAVRTKKVSIMKTCGIIAEYNPFHNGHLHHIEETRLKTGCDCIIAVMSGNFTQRGEPAIISKRLRAIAAVQNGVDIVIELPYIYSVQSATMFAKGAIGLLKAAHVDYLSFGSECGNLENLKEIAETPSNPDHLHQAMDNGMSYPEAYSLLTSNMLPNDILAVSYLKCLADTEIVPCIVKRENAYLSTDMHKNASALAIRKAVKEHTSFSYATPMEPALLTQEPVFPEMYYPYLRTFLLTSSRESLSSLFLFSEGIEKHLANAARISPTYESFMNNAVTHRYTASRIRRTCLSALCQVTARDVQKLPALQTLHILAFSDTGRAWLHEMRGKNARIASRFTDVPYPWRAMEYKAAIAYASVLSEERREAILLEETQGATYVKR